MPAEDISNVYGGHITNLQTCRSFKWTTNPKSHTVHLSINTTDKGYISDR